jgi:hypothetical protein
MLTIGADQPMEDGQQRLTEAQAVAFVQMR